MNFSMMPFGLSALASSPVSGLMRTVTMPSGTGTVPRRSGERLAHEIRPDRHRGAAAFLAAPSERSWSKPVQTVVTRSPLNPLNQASCASLVVPVLPAMSSRPSGARARRCRADDVPHHVRQQVGDLRAHDLRRQILLRYQRLAVAVADVEEPAARWAAGPIAAWIRGCTRSRRSSGPPEQRIARGVLDAIDVIRVDLEAAVGERRVGGHHLQRARLGGADRQREVIRQLRFVEAEARDVIAQCIRGRYPASGAPTRDCANTPSASRRRIGPKNFSPLSLGRQD
jgi:hypothetical protein